ncbi:hypothetical protein [Nonomuraea sp. B19D2]
MLSVVESFELLWWQVPDRCGAFDEFLRELIVEGRATIYRHLDPDKPVSA